MLFLLPPSESKRAGGSAGSSLDFDALSFPTLTKARRSIAASLVRLSKDADASMASLGIGPRLAGEVERNRRLRTSETLPALERYTGVAFDPIRAHLLNDDERAWASAHVAVHSALFGLIGAGDLIPAYRLSHDSRLPGIALRSVWQTPIRRALASASGVVVDLRSEAYSAMGPAPDGSVYVRVVSDTEGRRRALNHFNKKTKGTLVSRLVRSRPELETVDDFLSWASDECIVIERSAPGELTVVSESVIEA